MIDQTVINLINLVLGILGSLTGIGGLILTIVTLYRDGSVIKISHRKDIVGKMLDKKDNTVIVIRNFGKRSIQVGFVFLRRWDGKAIESISDTIFKLNTTLNESHPTLEIHSEPARADLSAYQYIGVLDNYGQEHRKYLSSIWFLKYPYLRLKQKFVGIFTKSKKKNLQSN